MYIGVRAVGESKPTQIGLGCEEEKGESCQWHAPLNPIHIISATIPAKGSNPVLAPECCHQISDADISTFGAQSGLC